MEHLVIRCNFLLQMDGVAMLLQNSDKKQLQCFLKKVGQNIEKRENMILHTHYDARVTYILCMYMNGP